MKVDEHIFESPESLRVGSPLWFEREAWRSLHKISDGSWDFSDSSLMYSDASVNVYKNLQQKDAEYTKNVTSVEHRIIHSAANQIVSTLPQRFAYIDLGPGTEHKERYIFDAVQSAGKTFEYFPVDISTTVLQESSRFAKERGIVVNPINDRFENIATKIDPSDAIPKFVSLGATFANYEPNDIIPMTLDLAGTSGSVMITAQLRERIDVGELQKTYSSSSFVQMCQGKLSLLGIASEDVGAFDVTDDVIIRAQIDHPNPKLSALGMMPGDWITVLKSYRWTLPQLEQILQKTNFSVHDTGESFVVVHLKTK